MSQTMTRFMAEWITRQHKVGGEWDPDQDEYSCSYHRSRAAAERAAIKAGKRAGQCEWIAVTEQELRPHRSLDAFMEWVEVKRWTGDWSGVCNEPSYVEEVES